MGFLKDIESNDRLGGYAILFWIFAGCVVGGGSGIYLVGYSETMVPVFVLVGALMGACIGFYAASAKTRTAWVLRLPGYPFAIIATLGGAR